MAHYIDKDAVIAEIEKFIERAKAERVLHPKTILAAKNYLLIENYNKLLSIIDTLVVKDPYEQCIQYPSVKDGIEAHAETYSFNLESELFNQLTKEQQALWRKEIEQACISGGGAGYELAKDPRYKENLEVKEVDLDNAKNIIRDTLNGVTRLGSLCTDDIIEHAVEDLIVALGLKARQG